MRELLERLCGLYGPSGREEEVREAIRGEIEGHVDEVRVDALGNLIARRRGAGPKLMLAAHLDELGVIVTDIDEHGFLRFLTVGAVPKGWQLTAARVVFSNGVAGVIGREKVEEPKEITYSKMFVDIGARSREEAQAKVKVGEMAVFSGPTREMGGRVTSKALDDRVGCALLVQVAREVKNSPNELIFVFTVQEEVGRRGASPATFNITPDAGLAVDVTPVGDTPESVRRTVSLGAGPAIKVMDAGHIVPPVIRDWMLDTAAREGIPHQREVLEGGATDAGIMQATGEGVPSGVLSVPCRYVHTPSEMVDLDDVSNSLRLLAALAANPLPIPPK